MNKLLTNKKCFKNINEILVETNEIFNEKSEDYEGFLKSVFKCSKLANIGENVLINFDNKSFVSIDILAEEYTGLKVNSKLIACFNFFCEGYNRLHLDSVYCTLWKFETTIKLRDWTGYYKDFSSKTFNY